MFSKCLRGGMLVQFCPLDPNYMDRGRDLILDQHSYCKTLKIRPRSHKQKISNLSIFINGRIHFVR